MEAFNSLGLQLLGHTYLICGFSGIIFINFEVCCYLVKVVLTLTQQVLGLTVVSVLNTRLLVAEEL